MSTLGQRGGQNEQKISTQFVNDPKGKTGCILYCKWHLYFSLRIVPCNKLSMVVKDDYHQCFVDASDNKVVDKAQLG